MTPGLPVRTGATTVGVAGLLVQQWVVHRWFARPFAVPVGWDEAYITAFAARMIEGRWLPYVDAVSHRGPLLYWLAAIVEMLGGGPSWLAFRHAAWAFSAACVVSLFLVGWLARRPLAGFVAASLFAVSTLYGMEPKDGIGFNGELVATPFAVLATGLTWVGIHRGQAGSLFRVSLALLAGVAVVCCGLCKQIGLLHAGPIVLWWLAGLASERKHRGKFDWAATAGLVLGLVVPVAALLTFYARSGHLAEFVYYFYTYNREVYLQPVSLGYAIESSYLFSRAHAELTLGTSILLAWGASRLAAARTRVPDRSWLLAFAQSDLEFTTALQLAVGLVGAIATFRYWSHYFVTTLPWFGLLIGMLVEGSVRAATAPDARRSMRSAAILVVAFVMLATGVLCRLTTFWLDGERRAGHYYDPAEDPLIRAVRARVPADASLFIWGFAADIYTSADRRPASRFVYTTIPAGVVPWFRELGRRGSAESHAPAARATLLQDLERRPPEVILDVPSTIEDQSIRQYPDMAAFVDRRYCFTGSVTGKSRVADVYQLRMDDTPCENTPPRSDVSR